MIADKTTLSRKKTYLFFNVKICRMSEKRRRLTLLEANIMGTHTDN